MKKCFPVNFAKFLRTSFYRKPTPVAASGCSLKHICEVFLWIYQVIIRQKNQEYFLANSIFKVNTQSAKVLETCSDTLLNIFSRSDCVKYSRLQDFKWSFSGNIRESRNPTFWSILQCICQWLGYLSISTNIRTSIKIFLRLRKVALH